MAKRCCSAALPEELFPVCFDLVPSPLSCDMAAESVYSENYLQRAFSMEAVTFSLGEPGRFIVLLSCFLSFGFSNLFSLASPLGNNRDISHTSLV